MQSKQVQNKSSGYIKVASQAAYQAGKIIMGGFRCVHQVRSKGPANLVSEIDVDSEKAIIAFLTNSYPEIPIVSEEADSPLINNGLCWIVDPLDGTTNYIAGVPFFCVNIALVRDCHVQAAVTYDPVHDELFTSEAGQGAYLDGKRIHVSNRIDLGQALVGSDIGYQLASGQETLEISKGLRERVLCLRVLGSAALGIAYVACGRYDIYFHRHLYPWDIAAGVLLVREAGGHVANWDWVEAEVDDNQIIATNRRLVSSFREALKVLS
jgi:myo-inositol-1(or 4)-monophosphatase